MVESFRNSEDIGSPQTRFLFQGWFRVSFEFEEQIGSRTESEMELSSFRFAAFEIMTGVRDQELKLGVFSSFVLLGQFMFLQLLFIVQTKSWSPPPRGCKHVFLYCIGVCSVLLIIKVGHMPFASPQEHHLTLQCCIRSLRWRAWEGVCTHGAAAEHSLADVGQPRILRSRQEMVPEGSVSKSNSVSIPLVCSSWLRKCYKKHCFEIYTFSITETRIR